ncbi:N-acetyltransferase [Oribacterium sp. WCC10]|uniref:N-acetyltransferase n=1 Tax=Oribacterium sp. WCC10 TaxID=1855343 RepID=UPI0008EB31BC|nr:N-acetyltransferase [Oribacterium sp. WCC10]SFG43441.1 hypothetical protein SAMN05216356_108117 [Oribacterium sp. WCC10]
MLRVRYGTDHDYDRIMEIYRYAQDYMIQSGNPNQWGHFYPESSLIKSDIQNGLCRVIFDEDGIHGVFALLEGTEPTYQHIENGEWLNDEPYVTIHRIAGDGLAHGLLRCAVDYCKVTSPNIRIDTHNNNHVMQRQIEKNGFKKCGTIYVADGSPRIAYHWSRL